MMENTVKFIVTQLLVFVTGHSILDLQPSMQRLLRGFQRPFSSHFLNRLSGPGCLISLSNLSSC